MKERFLFLLDLWRVKRRLLPKTEAGARAMGRRAGKFLLVERVKNPWLPPEIVITDYDGTGRMWDCWNQAARWPVEVQSGREITGLAKAWQEARNKEVWKLMGGKSKE